MDRYSSTSMQPVITPAIHCRDAGHKMCGVGRVHDTAIQWLGWMVRAAYTVD